MTNYTLPEIDCVVEGTARQRRKCQNESQTSRNVETKKHNGRNVMEMDFGRYSKDGCCLFFIDRNAVEVICQLSDGETIYARSKSIVLFAREQFVDVSPFSVVSVLHSGDALPLLPSTTSTATATHSLLANSFGIMFGGAVRLRAD